MDGSWSRRRTGPAHIHLHRGACRNVEFLRIAAALISQHGAPCKPERIFSAAALSKQLSPVSGVRTARFCIVAATAQHKLSVNHSWIALGRILCCWAVAQGPRVCVSQDAECVTLWTTSSSTHMETRHHEPHASFVHTVAMTPGSRCTRGSWNTTATLPNRP